MKWLFIFFMAFFALAFVPQMASASQMICQDETYSDDVPCLVVTPVINCTDYYTYNITNITSGANTVIVSNASLIPIGDGTYYFNFTYSAIDSSYGIVLCNNDSASINVIQRVATSSATGGSGGGGSMQYATLYLLTSSMPSEFNVNAANELSIYCYDHSSSKVNVDGINITFIGNDTSINYTSEEISDLFTIMEVSSSLGSYNYEVMVNTASIVGKHFKIFIKASKDGVSVADTRSFVVVDRAVAEASSETGDFQQKVGLMIIFGSLILLLCMLIYFIFRKRR